MRLAGRSTKEWPLDIRWASGVNSIESLKVASLDGQKQSAGSIAMMDEAPTCMSRRRNRIVGRLSVIVKSIVPNVTGVRNSIRYWFLYNEFEFGR